jgi:thiamine biosynthesis lipoprotein
MGTFVTLSIDRGFGGSADAVFRRVFSEIRETADRLNHFDPASEIGMLNANGELPRASADTLAVLQKALSLGALTEGAFDISVMPQILLWRDAARSGRPPTKGEAAAAQASVDYRNIMIEGDAVRFLRPGVNISLAGIAKGFVVDKAVSILRDRGVARAMVNGGGDIRVMSGVGGPPWRIGVRNPLHPKYILYTIEARDLAIASSGAYAHEYNDIIDPRSGMPVDGVAGVSVVADEATLADALATALTVLGPVSGIKLAEGFEDRGSAALLVEEDGARHRSSGWAGYCA